MAKTTITVQEDTLERFNQQKRALEGVQDGPDHNADSFLNALMDTWDASGDAGALADEAPQAFADHLVEELPDTQQVESEIAQLRQGLSVVEERTGEIQRTLDDMSGRR